MKYIYLKLQITHHTGIDGDRGVQWCATYLSIIFHF